MSEPRIAPGHRSDIGWINWIVSRVGGRVTGTGPPNLFLTLGRHRGLFRGWLRFAGRLMPGGKLPRRETELAILRVAHLRECEYEFTHHVRLGHRAGLNDVDIERVVEGPKAQGWSAREKAMLTVVDLLHRDEDIGDDAWSELRRHLEERGCIELILLVGHYEMLATFIRTLRIEPER